MGTSHSSQVGSLKSFGSYYKGKRLFGSDGDLAASMPVTAPMHAGRRKVAPAPDKAYNLVSAAGRPAGWFACAACRALQRACFCCIWPPCPRQGLSG